MSKKNETRQLRKISIDAKGKVKIDFVELSVTKEHETGDEMAEDETVVNEYSVRSPHAPHKDLLDSMKKLRKFALEICEMIFETKALTFYDISAIKINGDVAMKQSRVIFTISKEVRRTGKFVKIVTPETTMYGESEYERAAEMSKLVEVVIQEALMYLDGKGAQDSQMKLFTFKNSLMKVA